MVAWTDVAGGLRFPEGPVAMADGSIVLVEIAAGRITRVDRDGRCDVIAEPGGGPDGLAPRGPNDIVFSQHGGGRGERP